MAVDFAWIRWERFTRGKETGDYRPENRPGGQWLSGNSRAARSSAALVFDFRFWHQCRIDASADPSFPGSLRRFPRGVQSLQSMRALGPQRDKLLDKEIQNGRRPSFGPCRQKEL